MQYSDTAFNEKQEKVAQNIINNARKFLKIPDLEGEILYLNPQKYIADLQATKIGKSKKELKAINSRIGNVTFLAQEAIKIIFNLEDRIRQLTVTTGIQPTQNFVAYYYNWNALLDFPIPSPILFGRAHKKPAHKGGKYFFAPLAELNAGFLRNLDRDIAAGIADQRLYLYASTDKVLDLTQDLRHSREAFDAMKTMLQLVRTKQLTGIEMVDQLNQLKSLVKTMKSVGHFGNTVTLLFRHVSEVDVSTICLPMKVATLVQICNYEPTHKKTLKAVCELALALEGYAIDSTRIPWRPPNPEMYLLDIPSDEDAYEEEDDFDYESHYFGTPDVARFEESNIEIPEAIPPPPAPAPPEPDLDDLEQAIYAGLADKPEDSADFVYLMQKLDDPDPFVRTRAVQQLGHIGGETAVNQLIRVVLNDAIGVVRTEAAKHLGLLGDPIAVPVLQRVLKEDPDPEVRMKATDAIRILEKY